MKKLITYFLLFSPFFLNAQSNLLELLGDNDDEPIYSSYLFKGTKIVNGQSVKLQSKGVLQFEIQHRFGALNSGFYDFYGLDNSQIRMSLEYGVKDWLGISIARSSALKTIDANIKIRLTRQVRKSKSFPFTLVLNTAPLTPIKSPKSSSFLNTSLYICLSSVGQISSLLK